MQAAYLKNGFSISVSFHFWIFIFLVQAIFSKSDDKKSQEQYFTPLGDEKFIRSKSLTNSVEESKGKGGSASNDYTPKGDDKKTPSRKIRSRSLNLKKSQESKNREYKDTPTGEPVNVEQLKAGGEVYYQLRSSASLKICKLIGQIIGKAIFEDIPLEPKFTNFMMK